jgi:segregation and condensation protein A
MASVGYRFRHFEVANRKKLTVDFRVELEIYRGPIELLLYLIRRQEIDVKNVAIARIIQQYLGYLQGLQKIDVDSVGDFIEITSRLIEMKALEALPTPEALPDEEVVDDPREGLVERLLEYKKYRDAASLLEERSRRWQQTYPRLANDLPSNQVTPSEQPIREVELWDLVSALGRVLNAAESNPASNIVYDDVPIQTHMRMIHERIAADGRVGLMELLRSGMSKASVIGMFLAILELIRHHCVEADQTDPYGEIWVLAGESFSSVLELSQVDNYDGNAEGKT